MVFQQFNLFPYLTTQENGTLFTMRVRKTPKQEAAAVAIATSSVSGSRSRRTNTRVGSRGVSNSASPSRARCA